MRIDQMDPTEESKSVNRKATIQGTATLGATNIADYMYATDGKRAQTYSGTSSPRSDSA